MTPRIVPLFIAAALAMPLAAQEQLAAAAAANRLPLLFDGQSFSGPAWDRLVAEGRDAQFFLIGEEHGIAENAKLATALFTALQPEGYSKIVIEVSPVVARELDEAARKGIDGLRALYARPGGEPAFFGMKEEAELLATTRAAAKSSEPLFWGVDYEIGGDRLLISLLEQKTKPEAAKTALAALRKASSNSWKEYEETRNPRFIYSFAGDPALVRAVRDAWPDRDANAARILDVLEATFEINRLWMSGERFRSNERRGAFLRQNFIDHWLAARAAGRAPRALAKLGSSHLIRGRNMTDTWDLGSLLPEIAALEGRKAFHLLVLPGASSKVAVFNPSTWRYEPGAAKDGYAKGLDPILGAALPDQFTLIDLRALRPVLAASRDGSPELRRVVHGFDAVLVMSGSTPSVNLRQ